MMKPLNLQKIAGDAWKKILNDRWEFVTCELQARYGLTDPQATVVKKYIKQIATSVGILWGYDKEVNKFIMCPTDRHDIAVRILGYGGWHWKVAGQTWLLQLEAAYKQGFISKVVMNQGSRLMIEHDAGIEEVLNYLGYSSQVEGNELQLAPLA